MAKGILAYSWRTKDHLWLSPYSCVDCKLQLQTAQVAVERGELESQAPKLKE